MSRVLLEGNKMPNLGWRLLLAQRVRGRSSVAIGIVRVAVGAPFAFVFSLSKFIDHASEVADFKKFGVPVPEASTFLAGAVELIGGLLLMLGVLTRLAALLLAADMAGALLTAGRNVGGAFHLGVAPLMFVAMIVLLVTGPGDFAFDNTLARRLRRKGPSPTQTIEVSPKPTNPNDATNVARRSPTQNRRS